MQAFAFSSGAGDHPMTDGATQTIAGMIVGMLVIISLHLTIIGLNISRTNSRLDEINERLKLLLERKGREEEL
jgi:uncharacterized membrane protein